MYKNFVQPALSYHASYWVQKRFSKEEVTYTKKHWARTDKDYCYFHTGLVSRVSDFLDKKGVNVNIHTHDWSIDSEEPNIPGIILREDQEYLIRAARKMQRGIIHAATGIGKSILQIGLITSFNTSPILILIHTKDLVMQTIEKLRELGFGNELQQIGAGAGVPKIIRKPIVVSTIQSFKKLNPDVYRDTFEVLMVDECHHVSKLESNYGEVLQNILAPVRLGFTATLPTKDEAIFTLEGLIGPVIGSLDIDEAVKKNILAKPQVKILKVPRNSTVRKLKTYQRVYEDGIVMNMTRNLMILDIVKKAMENNETSLIIVNKLKHGDILRDLFEKKGLDIPFVEGKSKDTERKNIKQNLINKKFLAAICTSVWVEGIDIPPLEHVIYGGSGKAENTTLQMIGRGTRKVKGKNSMIFWDFFDDSHHYLVSHFGERISLYMEMGWL